MEYLCRVRPSACLAQHWGSRTKNAPDILHYALALFPPLLPRLRVRAEDPLAAELRRLVLVRVRVREELEVEDFPCGDAGGIRRALDACRGEVAVRWVVSDDDLVSGWGLLVTEWEGEGREGVYFDEVGYGAILGECFVFIGLIGNVGSFSIYN